MEIRFFVSHASEEAALAKQLERRLTTMGHTVWLCELEIKPGDSFLVDIITQIEKCDILLLCLSPTAVNSGWVKLEFDAADKLGKRIVPLLFVDCHVPAYLTGKDRVDMRTTSSWALGVQRLLELATGGSIPKVVNPISDAEFRRVWEELRLPMNEVQKAIDSLARLQSHLANSEELRTLLVFFRNKSSNDSNNGLQHFFDYFLRFPFDCFDNYCSWFNFAISERRLHVGEDAHRFALRLTPLDFNWVINIYYDEYTKYQNPDLAFTWTMVHVACGFASE